jgi:hypothetical protein
MGQGIAQGTCLASPELIPQYLKKKKKKEKKCVCMHEYIKYTIILEDDKYNEEKLIREGKEIERDFSCKSDM